MRAVEYLSPASLIKAASKATPAFKYAIAAAGIVALVATVAQFGASAASLLFGTIALLTVMVLFLLFSQATALSRSKPVPLPSLVLIWSFLFAGILASTFSFTSTFFNWPLPLRSVLLRSLAIEEPTSLEMFEGRFSGTVNTRAAGKSFRHRINVKLIVAGKVVTGDYENDAGDAGLLSGTVDSNNLKLKFISSKIIGDCVLNGSIDSARSKISALYRCSDDENAEVELERNTK